LRNFLKSFHHLSSFKSALIFLILWTALRYPYGAGALVLSDGKQHGRAILETDRISLHVNSWYGGTNAGLWEWEHNYGKGKLLKKGDRIQEMLRLRFARF